LQGVDRGHAESWESTPILRLDNFALPVDDGLHADGFLVQTFELAETPHPLRLVSTSVVDVPH
jgi:hypothetical protein